MRVRPVVLSGPGAPPDETPLSWLTVTEHAAPHHDHAPAPAPAEIRAGDEDAAGRGCCSDSPAARERQARARRLVVLSGVAGLAVVAVGLVIGGWLGGALVALVAVGIVATAAGSWSQLSLNDRLMRVAVVVLLIALALVRAFPR